MIRASAFARSYFSVNCYIATILAMFIAFRPDCGVQSSSETGALARLGTMAILV
jgi:hypothetical protein